MTDSIISDSFDPEISNSQMVGVKADQIVVLMPSRQMGKTAALVHAAYLVALAEEVDGEFNSILEKVKGA